MKLTNKTNNAPIAAGKKHSINYDLMPNFDAYFSQHFIQFDKNQNCPYHDHRTASLKLYRHKQSFFCFGCQKGGDILVFQIKTLLVTAAKAVKNKCPHTFVICGDNHAKGGGQRSATYAAKAVGGLVVNLNDD